MAAISRAGRRVERARAGRPAPDRSREPEPAERPRVAEPDTTRDSRDSRDIRDTSGLLGDGEPPDAAGGDPLTVAWAGGRDFAAEALITDADEDADEDADDADEDDLDSDDEDEDDPDALAWWDEPDPEKAGYINLQDAIEGISAHFHEHHDAIMRWSWKLFCSKWQRMLDYASRREAERIVREAKQRRDRRRMRRDQARDAQWQALRQDAQRQTSRTVGQPYQP